MRTLTNKAIRETMECSKESLVYFLLLKRNQSEFDEQYELYQRNEISDEEFNSISDIYHHNKKAIIEWFNNTI